MLQLAVLGVFVSLAVFGLGHYTPDGVNAKLYAKTNLVNLAIWGLWWPAIVWTTFLLGRAWCIVCPLELVSSQAQKLSSGLGIHQRPIGGWLARGSLVILFFALLQMLVPGVQIHRVPHYTSLFLWTSLGLALAVGLFFKDRAFCRGFCPVSLLLSAYGRGGMLAVRPADASCCRSADGPRPQQFQPPEGTTVDFAAAATGDRSRFDAKAPNARACPSLLNPARLNTSKDCLVCGDCIKADASGTMQLLVRPPYSRADAREPLASWPLTLFVMIVSGFVTYELSGVWKAAEPVFLWAPKQMSAALNLTSAGGWIQGFWTVLVVPLLLWLVLGAVTLAFGGAASLADAWRRLALPLAVVVATGHMAKGLEKFTSWIGFLPYAWAEPTGVQTAIKMNAKALAQPAAWFAPTTLSICAMLLLALGIGLALREARLADPGKGRARFASILLLGGFYGFLVFGWGGWFN